MADDPLQRAPETGACYNCAFLCHRGIVPTHAAQFHELTDSARIHYWFFPAANGFLVPWCFRQVGVLQEITDLSGLDIPYAERQEAAWREAQNAAAAHVFRRDRRCE